MHMFGVLRARTAHDLQPLGFGWCRMVGSASVLVTPLFESSNRLRFCQEMNAHPAKTMFSTSSHDFVFEDDALCLVGSDVVLMVFANRDGCECQALSQYARVVLRYPSGARTLYYERLETLPLLQCTERLSTLACTAVCTTEWPSLYQSGWQHNGQNTNEFYCRCFWVG
jgi:hypothetical protein